MNVSIHSFFVRVNQATISSQTVRVNQGHLFCYLLQVLSRRAVDIYRTTMHTAIQIISYFQN